MKSLDFLFKVYRQGLALTRISTLFPSRYFYFIYLLPRLTKDFFIPFDINSAAGGKNG